MQSRMETAACPDASNLKKNVSGRSIVLLTALTFLALLSAPSVARAETITVSVAASLADAFKQIAASYQKTQPADTVHLNLGASGSLLQQIKKGAPVDVLATADEATMIHAEHAGLMKEVGRPFATNTLVLIQPMETNHPMVSLANLQAENIRRVAIGNPVTVPVGRYTRQALESAGLWPTLQQKLIMGHSARQVLDYVARDEVDAGFVYGTDADLMKGKVKVAHTIPLEPGITYFIAATKRAENKPAAQRFVNYVLSPASQQILSDYGFRPAK